MKEIQCGRLVIKHRETFFTAIHCYGHLAPSVRSSDMHTIKILFSVHKNIHDAYKIGFYITFLFHFYEILYYILY